MSLTNKQLDKRALVVKEIIDTEKKYVSELQILVECFVEPSRRFLSGLKAISANDDSVLDSRENVEQFLNEHNVIFSNVEQLCAFNEVFLKVRYDEERREERRSLEA